MLKGPILELLASAGLQEDCPLDPEAAEKRVLVAEDADSIPAEVFEEYASRVYKYLQARAARGVVWLVGGGRRTRSAFLPRYSMCVRICVHIPAGKVWHASQ